MIIKRTAVGNRTEAYIENRFSSGLNIISSDDNNKGKTIEIQSMMYALGNEPTFPASFDYKQYYHYVEFEVDNKTYHLCRYNNGFVLKSGSVLMLFDNVSELKRYWNKNIFRLPQIVKNLVQKIVDPVLFLQLFFVGQDKKDSSNIAHSGFYNKTDYINMLFDICGLSGVELDESEIQKTKERISRLKNERYILLKQHRILKSQDISVNYLSSVSDKTTFGKKLKDMEKLYAKITELRKARNTAATRKANWESTLKELRSLNRSMEFGELRCMDCNSTNIAFSASKKNAYAFDVSSIEMRNEIVESINEKIESYEEEMTKLSEQISLAQSDLKFLMEDDNVSLETIVAYKNDVFTALDAEIRIKEIDSELNELSDRLKASDGTRQSKKEQRIALLDSIIKTMNDTYQFIDPNGNLVFDDLFSKKDEVYSGSEATMFHLSRLYALSTALQHNYPIVVDSFRAEDLSTVKEKAVLDLFSSLPNQVVFTTTLKQEELGKYDSEKRINHIDYRDHSSSKMLTAAYLEEFFKIMNFMSVNID